MLDLLGLILEVLIELGTAAFSFMGLPWSWSEDDPRDPPAGSPR